MKTGLFIDIGLAETGVSVFQLDSVADELLYTGYTTTKKSNLKVAAGQDLMNRMSVNVEFIVGTCATFFPSVVGVELPTGGARDAQAGRALGMCIGACSALELLCKVKVLTVTPNDVKKSVCGNIRASKHDMQEAIALMYPRLRTEYHSNTSTNGFTGVFEDIADSIGVYKALQHHSFLNDIRKTQCT